MLGGAVVQELEPTRLFRLLILNREPDYGTLLSFAGQSGVRERPSVIAVSKVHLFSLAGCRREAVAKAGWPDHPLPSEVPALIVAVVAAHFCC